MQSPPSPLHHRAHLRIQLPPAMGRLRKPPPRFTPTTAVADSPGLGARSLNTVRGLDLFLRALTPLHFLSSSEAPLHCGGKEDRSDYTPPQLAVAPTGGSSSLDPECCTDGSSWGWVPT